MAKRAYKWVWTARIDPKSLPALQELAQALGFVVDVPGGKLGQPATPTMLDSLAAAYRRDPDGVRLALKTLGVVVEKESAPAD